MLRAKGEEGARRAPAGALAALLRALGALATRVLICGLVFRSQSTMSFFSQDQQGAPFPLALKNKEKLAKSDDLAVQRGLKPAPPSTNYGIKAPRDNKKTCVRRKPNRVMHFTPEMTPRDPWFNKAEAAVNGLHKNMFLEADKLSTWKTRGQRHGYADFKSTVLECEWRFREARNIIEARQPEQQYRQPDGEFVNVCCKVLGELAPACGPIRRLLTELREEFARHIYSDFDIPAPGNTGLCRVSFLV